MAKHLTRELDALQGRLLALAGLAEEAVDRAARALRGRDTALAAAAVAADTTIDLLENEIQEECLKILALHQPVAADLRRVAAVFSITTDLERIGDLAVDIADRAAALADATLPTPDRIDRLTNVVTVMVRQAIEAFLQHDSRLAARVIGLDDEADQLHAEVIAELISGMKADPAAVDAGVSLFSVARHLERIGDHATNIAEDVVYLVEGEIIRRRPAARGRPAPI